MASNRSQHADLAWRIQSEPDWPPDNFGQVLSRVQLPLSNAEYALEQFLLSNGPRLDTETRMLLAGVRDCIGRVALSARRLTEEDGNDTTRVNRAA
ncbi:MAG: hypothetical protein OEN23_02595 [Paracoccaceae bacterium]|nr:hypothetical protein [Paracoccaceae bacterium]